MNDKLCVVMPAYNEASIIEEVVREWIVALRREGVDFVLQVIDDGSTDATAQIIAELARELPEIRLFTKQNSGHGQSCVCGYRLALATNADWVFQIDSDGQCDPQFFARFWRSRATAPVTYGFRKVREDGRARYWMSRIVSFAGLVSHGVWVHDANVPYRLMNRGSVEAVVDLIPPDLHLANVLVAILQQQSFGIRWIDIAFRKRTGGTPMVKALGFVCRGWELITQLRRARGFRRSDANLVVQPDLSRPSRKCQTSNSPTVDTRS